MTPRWLEDARLELGQAEVPGPGSNPRIEAYRKMAHVALDGDDGFVPWCAIFVNAMLENAGIYGTRSGLARSFTQSPHFMQLTGPALGAVTVWGRGEPDKGFGHCGFYVGETKMGEIASLGGNQGDKVSIALFPRQKPAFWLIGFFWPMRLLMPAIAPVAAPVDLLSGASVV